MPTVDVTWLLPEAGDAVRLTAPWPWAGSLLKVGEIGIIGGRVGIPCEHLQITWHASAFRGWPMYGCPEFPKERFSQALQDYLKEQPVYVSCSGGPGTIALPSRLLVPTQEIIPVRFWAWSERPQANGGFQYQLSVPVWLWDGQGYD